ncbi:motility associated factor glycosyltransferase family protein [Oceanobacillus zhaokaii]|nr:6-hydroxymethylpterin diphosphokinase MptE-like protein [Oceanobacillus zhaokaii]
MNISIVETKTIPTIKIEYNNKNIILHSKYDPIREVNAWCKNAIAGLSKQQEVIIIGLGAGYHIKQLSELLPEKKITVVEFNDDYYRWFKTSPFYEKVYRCINVIVKQYNSLSSTEQQELFTGISSSNLLIHKSGLDLIPSKCKKVKEILDDMQFKKHSIKNQIGNMKANFTYNSQLQDEGIGKLKNMYGNKPMILISAGPSLDKQMTLLKRIHKEGKVVLGAVGTALKPLIKNNITPDFFSIIDPNPGTYEQLKNLDLPITTLYYLSTAYHETITLHTGPRYIMWQEGYEDAEKKAAQLGDSLIQTGGSVATALLDLMVYLGAGPLALVGQDLAFTNGLSHANYAHAQRDVNETLATLTTLDYHRTEQVPTAKNLTIYRKWFEDYALNHGNLELYNCTEGGAYINHWEHIRLKEFYEKVIYIG